MDEALILKDELKESERIISQLNKELTDLKSKVKLEKNNSQLFQENIMLDKEHKNNLKDIKDYKSQLNEIERTINSQKSQMDALIKENEKLKANLKKKSENKPAENKIKDISDLKRSLEFFLKDLKDIENEENKEEEKSVPDSITEEEFKNLKKIKEEKEILFNKIKDEIVSYDEEVDKEMIYINNFRDYVDSINNQIRSFKQQLRVSIVGGINFNFGKMTDDNADLLIKELEETSLIINQVNELVNISKDNILKKAENILIDIQTSFSEIDDNKKLDYGFLSIRMNSIENKIEN